MNKTFEILLLYSINFMDILNQKYNYNKINTFFIPIKIQEKAYTNEYKILSVSKCDH